MSDLTLPAEPCIGAVAVDREHDAWQRHEAGWRRAGYRAFHTWADLVRGAGPITVVWTPGMLS